MALQPAEEPDVLGTLLPWQPVLQCQKCAQTTELGGQLHVLLANTPHAELV